MAPASSGASIDATTLFGSGGDASLQTYCKAMGIAFSPALTDQEQGSSILSRWLQILNCAAVWSGGMLKFIPYGDDGDRRRQRDARRSSMPIPTPVHGEFRRRRRRPRSRSAPPRNSSPTAASKYAFTGVALTYVGACAPIAAGTYGISPAGTYLFAGGDENQVVAIAYTYADRRRATSPT